VTQHTTNKATASPLEVVYQATLNKWGEEAQFDQMIEECAELIAALKHYKRGRISKDEVINELADVKLMVGQLGWMFGGKELNNAVDNKLKKLEGLLKQQ
jgi:NTP pyrophosphatase (non-canonical NTP hydrolase)